MKPRPSWNERMLRLAREWEQYSTCLRSQVGAVLFDPDSKAVISIGYNDTPIGRDDCGDGGCPTCKAGEPVSSNTECLCVHSEQNCIALAARRGARTEGAHMAATKKPCNACRKLMMQAGIAVVFTKDSTEKL